MLRQISMLSFSRFSSLKKLIKIPICQCSTHRNQNTEQAELDSFERVLKNNRQWAKEMVTKRKDFFTSLQFQQKPEFLWIGCSDSRVPANELLGLECGEVFVHRNVANLAPPSDMGVLATVQYAVETLKVKQILVGGHYGCGGIKAAFTQHDFGPLESWLCHVRDLRSQYKSQLIGPQQLQERALVEINVKKQVLNVARIAVVQKAWANNVKLRIHGVIYDMATGLLNNTGIELSSVHHLPSQFRISSNVTV